MLPDFLRHLVKGLGGRDSRGLQRLYGFPQLIKIDAGYGGTLGGCFSGLCSFLVDGFKLPLIFCGNLQPFLFKTGNVLPLLFVNGNLCIQSFERIVVVFLKSRLFSLSTILKKILCRCRAIGNDFCLFFLKLFRVFVMCLPRFFKPHTRLDLFFCIKFDLLYCHRP